MNNVFKGPRRKLGCLTLALACVLAGQWLRSCVVQEELSFTLSGRLHAIHSTWGGISWIAWSDNQFPPTFEWYYCSITAKGGTRSYSPRMVQPPQQLMWTQAIGERLPQHFHPWRIRYWTIVLT